MAGLGKPFIWFIWPTCKQFPKEFDATGPNEVEFTVIWFWLIGNWLDVTDIWVGSWFSWVKELCWFGKLVCWPNGTTVGTCLYWTVDCCVYIPPKTRHKLHQYFIHSNVF